MSTSTNQVAPLGDSGSEVGSALARSQPAFPTMPGMPERATHDYIRHGYIRHGTTSLFGAFNTADGTVISALHRRHRTTEFKKFLTKIDATVPRTYPRTSSWTTTARIRPRRSHNGKSGKSRGVPLHPSTARALRAYASAGPS